jgi:hypothetical protein
MAQTVSLPQPPRSELSHANSKGSCKRNGRVRAGSAKAVGTSDGFF